MWVWFCFFFFFLISELFVSFRSLFKSFFLVFWNLTGIYLCCLLHSACWNFERSSYLKGPHYVHMLKGRMNTWLVAFFHLDLSRQMAGEGNGTPLQYSCLENPMDGGAWWAAVHGVANSWTRLSNFTFTFHFHALEKEMATHSSVLAWRIPGTAEPGGLPSMGSHRIGHDWSDLAAAAGRWQIIQNTDPLINFLVSSPIADSVGMKFDLSESKTSYSWFPTHSFRPPTYVQIATFSALPPQLTHIVHPFQPNLCLAHKWSHPVLCIVWMRNKGWIFINTIVV